MTFLKFDYSKPKLSLIPIQAKHELARVLEFGAIKYGKDNWKQCDDFLRYINASLRHIDAYIEGKEDDQESNHHHLAHAVASLMFVLELELNKRIMS